MNYYMKNSTIVLHSQQEHSVSNHDERFHLVEAELAIHPKLMNLEDTYEWGIWAARWTLFWIGTYFKFVLYAHLWDKYKKREFKPIDWLILVTSVVQHLNAINLIYNGLLVMLFDISSEQLVTEWVCTLPRLLFQFEVCYSCIGSLGVSIFRIIYIKKELWMKYTLGEKNMLVIVLSGGFAITGVCMFLLSYNDYDRTFKETCLLSPSAPLLQVLDEYEQSLGNDSIYSHWIQCRRILFIILVAATLFELIIYIIFFHHMYQHDNDVKLQVLLGSKVIRRRNQRNAITFFGQFCSFAFEIGLNMVMISAVEAHAFLSKKGYNVDSYGTGDKVKLPGPTADKPNVYEFGTTYEEIYTDLTRRDKVLYTQNGILNMLDRNRRIKKGPQRLQDTNKKYDIIFTAEERVYDQVLEHFCSDSCSISNQPVHVINLDIQDNHEEATIGAFMMFELMSILAKSTDVDDDIDDLLQDFESKCNRPILHTVVFY